MFTDVKHLPLHPSWFNNANRGDVCEISSGLGGSWDLTYDRPTPEGEHVLIRKARPDWPKETFKFRDSAEAAKHCFIGIPDSDYELQYWSWFNKHPEGKHLKCPERLPSLGEKAWREIFKFLLSRNLTYTGGCTAFYSPQQWRERKEEYGCDSELIVCHDGGNLSDIFNLDHEMYDLNEEMRQCLDAAGLWSEACTCWYTAIYKK